MTDGAELSEVDEPDDDGPDLPGDDIDNGAPEMDAPLATIVASEVPVSMAEEPVSTPVAPALPEAPAQVAETVSTPREDFRGPVPEDKPTQPGPSGE
jgi:hypothetical protein